MVHQSLQEIAAPAYTYKFKIKLNVGSFSIYTYISFSMKELQQWSYPVLPPPPSTSLPWLPSSSVTFVINAIVSVIPLPLQRSTTPPWLASSWCLPLQIQQYPFHPQLSTLRSYHQLLTCAINVVLNPYKLHLLYDKCPLAWLASSSRLTFWQSPLYPPPPSSPQALTIIATLDRLASSWRLPLIKVYEWDGQRRLMHL